MRVAQQAASDSMITAVARLHQSMDNQRLFNSNGTMLNFDRGYFDTPTVKWLSERGFMFICTAHDWHPTLHREALVKFMDKPMGEKVGNGSVSAK